ncbi:arylesterase [Psychrobacter sp. 2Y5]|uniref:arylesterase n=1 Tax=unclassified Psychrobacter TaxID=196806 RepID=UPI003F47825D
MKSKTLSLVNISTYSLIITMVSAGLLISGCQDKPETNEPQATKTTTNAPVQAEGTSSISTAEQQVISQPITILALGDSLTEGLGVERDGNYPAQLEAKLKEMGYVNVDVVNSGLSGETSTGLVNRLDWVTQTEPDITILTIGANDAIRGLDVATIEDNIRTAVKHLQDNGSEVILGGMQIYDNLGNAYVQSFSDIYPRIAEDMNVPMIPFFLEGVGGVSELNQADAIHPTKEGYTIIVDNNILPVLKPEVDRMLQSMQANSLTPVETSTTETAQ